MSQSVAVARTAFDRVAQAAAYSAAVAVAENSHSCMAVVVHWVHPALAVVDSHWASDPAALEALAAYTAAWYWTWSRRDLAVPEAGHLSSSGSDLGLAAPRQRCWRRRHPAGRRRQGQIARRGHNRGPAGLGIGP